MAKIKQMTTVFASGDELILELKNSTFAGYQPAKVWQLTYGERYEGNYGDDTPTEDAHHFMATGIEYFSIENFDKAMAAFISRSNSEKPYKTTAYGQQLDSFLIPDVK